MKLEWKAEDVLRAVRGNSLHEQTWTANNVTINSKEVHAGDLFIALIGPTHDAHNYVAQAFENGATAAIVQKTPPQVPADAPLIFVDDTFSALQNLGRAGRQRAQAKIIGVTGSVGKTSSKEQLRVMLGACGDVYANTGSFNNCWGVPISLSRLPADAQWGVIEMGMNHAGEITPLTQDAKPHVALITNIEAVHLEHFGTLEAIADAKAEIFLGMDADGIAVLNRETACFAQLAAAAKARGLRKILSFGRDAKTDARLLSCDMDEDGSTVEADIMGHKLRYRISTAGEHIAFNSIGTLLAATAAGADPVVCAEALAAFRPLFRRGVREKITLLGNGSFTLIDETFNAGPASMKATIQVLGKISTGPKGRRIAVLGDMLELGPASPLLHESLAKSLTASKIDRVYCCGEMMTHLFKALPDAMRGAHVENSTKLAPLVAAEVGAGDVVMIKGSKSVHMEYVVEALKALNSPLS